MKRKFLAKQGISVVLSTTLLLSGALPAAAATDDTNIQNFAESELSTEAAFLPEESAEDSDAYSDTGETFDDTQTVLSNNKGLTITKVGNAESMPEAETNGVAAVAIVLSSEDQELYDYYTKLDDILVDGKSCVFNSTSQDFVLYNGILYIYDDEIISHFDNQTAHRIVLQFQDGSETVYEDDGYVEPEDTGNGNVVDGVTIQNVQVVDSFSSKELLISLNVDYTEIAEFFNKVTEIYINDISVDKSKFYASYKGLVSGDEEVIALMKESGNTAKLVLQDGRYLEYGTGTETPEEPEETAYALENVELVSNYGVSELRFTLNETDSDKLNSFLSKEVKEFEINGEKVSKDKFYVSSLNGLLSVEEDVIALFNAEGDNEVHIYLNDGQVISWPKGTAPEEPDPEQPEENYTFDNAEVVDSYGSKELHITLNETDYDKLTAFLNDQVKEFQINGTTVSKDVFHVSMLNGILTNDESAIALFKEDGGNTISILLNNGTTLTWTDGTGEEDGDYTIADKLPAGDYTIGFDALNADTDESSMLSGFFDENVKLTVKEDGSMTISMLNILFAYSLYDLRIENNGEWPESQKEWFGEPDINGKYSQAIFTLPITDLKETHLGGVLVGHMGAQESYIGNIDKYTKVRIVFKEKVKKGWEGYKTPLEEEEMIKNSDKVLKQRLIDSGVDTNSDGEISKEELQNATGVIDISGSSSTEKIYNIDILKDLGPGVTTLYAQGNHITSLPEGIFDNATGLQTLYLSGNNLTSIPAHLFDKNTELTEVTLASNPIGDLPEGLFDYTTKLQSLDLSKIQIPSLPDGIFKNLSDLEYLYLYENNLSALADDIFSGLSSLKSLHMATNTLQAVPESVGELTNLTTLDISHNNISELPASMKNLTSLTRLAASYNSISKIPDEVWTTLASSGDGTAELEENCLTSLPEDIILSGKGMYSMSVAYNYLPVDMPYGTNASAMGISPETSYGYYPQKTALDLSAKASEGTIQLIQDPDIDAIDMLYWKDGDSTFWGGKGVLQSKQEYLDYLAEKGKTAEDILLNEKEYNWTIVTDIDKTRDGNTTNLIDDTNKNRDDDHLTFQDSDMQAGDVYTITKTAYMQTATEGMNRVFQVQTTVTADSDIPEDMVKTYEVPVTMQKAYGEGVSMGNNALDGNATVRVMEGTSEIEISFKEMALDGLSGHLTRLYYYDSLEDMKDGNTPTLSDVLAYDGEYPRTVKIKNSEANPEQIGIRIWVDVMDQIAGGEGKGAQDAILVLDWDNAVEVDTQTEDKENFQQTTTSVNVSAESYNTVAISWDNVENADGYYVYKKASTDKNWKRIATCGADTTSYLYDEAVTGQKTSYTVKAFWKVSDDQVIYTKYPTDISATCKLETPQVKATAYHKQGTVTWDSVEGATNYFVYRSDNYGKNWKKLASVSSKTLKYTDKTASYGKTYYYTVRAVRKSGDITALSSYVKNVKITCTLPTPSVTAVSKNSTSATINWKKVSGASSYIVYRSTGDNKNWKSIKTVSSNTTSYTDKNVSSARVYYYTVRAVAKSGNKQIKSSYVKDVFCKILPGAPSVTAKAVPSTGIKVSWKKPAGASYYKVYRSEGSNKKWRSIATVNSKTLSYTDTNAEYGKTYYYTVRAVNGNAANGGTVVMSNYYTNISCKMVPGTPSVTVKSSTSGVNLSWKKIMDATHYRVYRKTSANGTWKKLKTVGSQTLSFTDSTAKKGQTYYYAVKALVKTGDVITGGSYKTVTGKRK